MPHTRAKECLEILDHKIKEYIRSHDHFHSKGYLSPHDGEPEAHQVMDEIMADVQQAHDMLEIAMKRAGLTWEDMHRGTYEPGAHKKLEGPGIMPPRKM